MVAPLSNGAARCLARATVLLTYLIFGEFQFEINDDTYVTYISGLRTERLAVYDTCIHICMYVWNDVVYAAYFLNEFFLSVIHPKLIIHNADEGCDKRKEDSVTQVECWPKVIGIKSLSCTAIISRVQLPYTFQSCPLSGYLLLARDTSTVLFIGGCIICIPSSICNILAPTMTHLAPTPFPHCYSLTHSSYTFEQSIKR